MTGRYKGKLATHIAGYDGWLCSKIRANENIRIMNHLEVPDVSTAREMLQHQRSDDSSFEERGYYYAWNVLNSKGQSPSVTSKVSSETVHIAISLAWQSKPDEEETANTLEFYKTV